jgi:hypothetical protein
MISKLYLICRDNAELFYDYKCSQKWNNERSWLQFTEHYIDYIIFLSCFICIVNIHMLLNSFSTWQWHSILAILSEILLKVISVNLYFNHVFTSFILKSTLQGQITLIFWNIEYFLRKWNTIISIFFNILSRIAQLQL